MQQKAIQSLAGELPSQSREPTRELLRDPDRVLDRELERASTESLPGDCLGDWFRRMLEKVTDGLFEGEEAVLHVTGTQIASWKRRNPWTGELPDWL